MYNLDQQHHHLYPYPSMPQQAMTAPVATTAPPRQYANHSNSSAFSSSANPDEDWTKISDLAERRRIQNRIAQRNYRKKLKRLREALERRAGTIDLPVPTKPGSGRTAGSNSKPSKVKKQQHTLSSLSAAAAQQAAAQQAGPRQPSPYHAHTVMISSHKHHTPSHSQSQNHQYSPPMHSDMHPDEDMLYPHSYDDARHNHGRRSNSPFFITSPAFSAYPPPEDSISSSSTSTSSPPSIASATPRQDYREFRGYDYSGWSVPMPVSVPVTLPSMTHSSDGLVKREPMDDCLSGSNSAAAVIVTLPPYMGTYGFLPTTGIDSVNPYDANPHTPPLSSSYDHSTSCSDAGYEYPTTPLSMASPRRL